MSTIVATNNTPHTVVAKSYTRQNDEDENGLPRVAVKDRRKLPNALVSTEPDRNISTGKKQDESTWEKRYGDLRAYEQKKSKEFQDQINELKTQLAKKNAQEQVNTLPKTPEEVKAWAETYKESFDIIRTVAVSETATQIEALQRQIDALTATNEQTSQEKSAAILTTLVPDWRELDKSMDFHAWLKKDTRKAWADIVYNSADPYAIAEILDTYKARNKKEVIDPTPKPKNDVDAALGVTSSGTVEIDMENNDGFIKESDVKRLTRREFEQYEEVIDKARREGKFIYDVTGKAQ